jgi:hypothetical protein
MQFVSNFMPGGPGQYVIIKHANKIIPRFDLCWFGIKPGYRHTAYLKRPWAKQLEVRKMTWHCQINKMWFWNLTRVINASRSLMESSLWPKIYNVIWGFGFIVYTLVRIQLWQTVPCSSTQHTRATNSIFNDFSLAIGPIY